MEYKIYSLFLDDVRLPKQVTWVELPLVDWVVVRNFDEFIAYIKIHGCPTRVSFDHDLAPEHYNDDLDWSKPLHMTELTGMDCVKWLVDYCIGHNKQFPEYYLHTLNNQGKLNMESYISSFKKSLIDKPKEENE